MTRSWIEGLARSRKAASCVGNEDGHSACSASVTRRDCAGVLAFGSASLLGNGAFAASDNFYLGKTIDMIIGYPPAASNDLYARAVAEHLPRVIPGAPRILPRNMQAQGASLQQLTCITKQIPTGLRLA
jgi:hypothetical protein